MHQPPGSSCFIFSQSLALQLKDPIVLGDLCQFTLTSKFYRSPFKNESLTQVWPTAFALTTAFLLDITDYDTHI